MKPLVLSLVGCASIAGIAQAAPSYEREIAPILRIYCSGCHNDRDDESEFSVERFASLRRGGAGAGDPVVPGDAAGSLMIRRITSTGADHMPPADEPQVPAAELRTLEAWITAGAPGPAIDASILDTLVVPSLAPARAARPVTAAALTTDRRRLAVARGRTIEILAVEDGAPGDRPLVTIADLPGPVAAVHFNRDGSRLVVATGIPGLRGVAEVRDAATGALVRTYGGHRDLVYDAELSPDEATLATSGYDRSIKLWNAADGSLLRSIDVHNGAVFDLAWHPSGRVLASASADETVKLWRTSDGERLDTLSQPQGGLTGVAFTSDGRHVLAAGRDKRIYLWNLVSLDAPAINPLIQARYAHEAPIVALAADGGRLVTAAEDRTVKVWTLPDLEPVADLPRQADVAAVIVPAGDGVMLGRMDGRIERAAVAAAPAPPLAATVPPPRPETPAPQREKPPPATESEPNDAPSTAAPVPLPATVKGAIASAGDADCFRFTARQGEPLVVEVIAATGKPASRIDSRVEVLHSDGRPVEQVMLQAVRDSWFTFRGKDSSQSNDFRLQNWDEMELDQYVYANGEVVKLWLYPRGPDSGFDVYPGGGSRHAFFHTTPVTHALGEPAWVVESLAPGAAPVPNGLPVFRLVYDNDDESTRRMGTDSHLVFVAPADGEYVARVTDIRGFGGPLDHHYTLAIRPPQPSFTVAIGGRDPKVSPGSGRELTFTATRMDGFDGPIRIEVDHAPAGFTFHGPIEIEAGQRAARGVLSATVDAVAPDDAADKAVRVRAIATIAGAEVVRDLGTLGDIQLAGPPKLTVAILPGADPAVVREVPGEPLEFTIRPGQTIPARVRIDRRDFGGAVGLGKEDAGRNLPHGVFVDNIGLNGLLVVEGQVERDFFIKAAPKAPPGRRLFFIRSDADDGQASPPVVINVLPRR